jgi:hypothetical protein
VTVEFLSGQETEHLNVAADIVSVVNLSYLACAARVAIRVIG